LQNPLMNKLSAWRFGGILEIRDRQENAQLKGKK
jgi:hypothetical protein